MYAILPYNNNNHNNQCILRHVTNFMYMFLNTTKTITAPPPAAINENKHNNNKSSNKITNYLENPEISKFNDVDEIFMHIQYPPRFIRSYKSVCLFYFVQGIITTNITIEYWMCGDSFGQKPNEKLRLRIYEENTKWSQTEKLSVIKTFIGCSVFPMFVLFFLFSFQLFLSSLC